MLSKILETLKLSTISEGKRHVQETIAAYPSGRNLAGRVHEAFESVRQRACPAPWRDDRACQRDANERRSITADTALRLARCFSTTPEFWMNLQQRYELEAAHRAIGTVVAFDLAG